MVEKKLVNLPKYLLMESKFAEICYKIQDHKLHLDVEKAKKYIAILTNEIEELDKQILPSVPKVSKQEKPLVNIYKKDGELNSHAINWVNSGQPYNINGNIMERWTLQTINLGHPAALVKYLKSIGWVPREDPDRWNYKQIKTPYGKLIKLKDANGNYIRTSPKLPKEDWELDELAKISPQFRLIAERMKRRHRLGAITGYIKNSKDSKIPMVINPCGCNTMRVKHKIVCNIPRVDTYYGKEMRDLFTASPGKVLVGADIDGLEACMLANMLNDKGFISFIKKNNYKYHKFFEIVLKDFIDGYDKVKSFDFALIYGGGDPKLGSMCNLKRGNQKDIGAQAREHAMRNIPGLDRVVKKLTKEYIQYKGIFGCDDRWIPVRKKSALINTKCQGDGAIVSKYWTCYVKHNLDKLNIPYKIVIYYHDELGIECDKENASTIGDVMLYSIKQVSKYLKLNLELSASYKIGTSWGSIH